MMVGSPAEAEEQLHDHLQVLVYHPHLQGNPEEVLHVPVDCVAGVLQKGEGRLDPGLVGLLQAEAAGAELSVSELSLQLPVSAPPESGY